MNIFLKSFVLLLCFSISTTAIGEEKKDTKTEAVAADVSKTVKKKKEDEEKEEGKNWRINLGTGLRIGQGTFVSLAEDSELNQDLRDTPGDPGGFADRVSLSMSAGASYTLKPITLGLSIGASQWISNTGSNTPQEFRLGDLNASVGWSGYNIEAIDTRVTAGLGFRFPTSKGTRISNLIVGTSGRIGLSKTFFKKLSLSAGVSGSKGFHSNISPSADPEDAGKDNIIFRSGGNEVLENGTVVLGGVNREYSLGFNLGASFPIVQKLRMSIGYSFSNSWAYNRDNDDEFRPDVVDENGNRIADAGRSIGQSMSGRIGLSYPLVSDWHGFSIGANAGLSSGQSPKTSDNKSFNFPFWNFNGAAANRSAVSFGLNASY